MFQGSSSIITVGFRHHQTATNLHGFCLVTAVSPLIVCHHLHFLHSLSYFCHLYHCVIRMHLFLQVSRGKGLQFKRLEDFLKDSRRTHRDETRISRSEHRPADNLPLENHKLAFAVRIREYVLLN